MLASSFTQLTVLLAVGALLLGAFAAWWAMSSVRPLKELTARMRRLADGDLEVDVPSTDRGDEVGEISRAVAVFKPNGLERIQIEREAAPRAPARVSAKASQRSRAGTASAAHSEHVTSITSLF